MTKSQECKEKVKGAQSALDPVDLVTSFLTEKNSPLPEIKVHPENRSVLLDFQLVTAWKTCFWVCFCSSYNIVFIIFS